MRRGWLQAAPAPAPQQWRPCGRPAEQPPRAGFPRPAAIRSMAARHTQLGRRALACAMTGHRLRASSRSTALRRLRTGLLTHALRTAGTVPRSRQRRRDWAALASSKRSSNCLWSGGLPKTSVRRCRPMRLPANGNSGGARQARPSRRRHSSYLRLHVAGGAVPRRWGSSPIWRGAWASRHRLVCKHATHRLSWRGAAVFEVR